MDLSRDLVLRACRAYSRVLLPSWATKLCTTVSLIDEARAQFHIFVAERTWGCVAKVKQTGCAVTCVRLRDGEMGVRLRAGH